MSVPTIMKSTDISETLVRSQGSSQHGSHRFLTQGGWLSQSVWAAITKRHGAGGL